MSYAFVFPGQGSQSIGMLSELYEQAIVVNMFDQASALLGYDLLQLIKNGPEEELNRTEVTQPAILVASVACYRLWLEKGLASPKVMSGHSLGEYSALVCADAMQFDDAVTLVRDRGRFMQDAVAEGEGAMAAILGLDDEAVISLCEDASQTQVLSAANFNSPGQVVIAGESEAVARAVELAKERGAKRALPLAVSVPSHCLLMKPAAEKLAGRLADMSISTPSVPVIHNVDGQSKSDSDAIKQALVDQLYQPVRWVECVHALTVYDVKTVVECGPGKVLAGLMKRIDRSINSKNLNSVTDFSL